MQILTINNFTIILNRFIESVVRIFQLCCFFVDDAKFLPCKFLITVHIIYFTNLELDFSRYHWKVKQWIREKRCLYMLLVFIFSHCQYSEVLWILLSYSHYLRVFTLFLTLSSLTTIRCNTLFHIFPMFCLHFTKSYIIYYLSLSIRFLIAQHIRADY